MSKEFVTLHSNVERLIAIHHQGERAFRVLSELSEFSSADEYEYWLSRDHADMFRVYGKFFDTIRDSLSLDIHMQLAKLLIDDRESLHVNHLIKYATSADGKIRRSIASKDLEEPYEDLELWYKGLDDATLEEVKTQLIVHKWLIDKLELARNKKLAHEDKKDIPAESLTLDELEKLLKLSERLINKVTIATYGWNDISKLGLYAVNDDTKLMLERLYENTFPRS